MGIKEEGSVPASSDQDHSTQHPKDYNWLKFDFRVYFPFNCVIGSGCVDCVVGNDRVDCVLVTVVLLVLLATIVLLVLSAKKDD